MSSRLLVADDEATLSLLTSACRFTTTVGLSTTVGFTTASATFETADQTLQQFSAATLATTIRFTTTIGFSCTGGLTATSRLGTAGRLTTTVGSCFTTTATAEVEKTKCLSFGALKRPIKPTIKSADNKTRVFMGGFLDTKNIYNRREVVVSVSRTLAIFFCQRLPYGTRRRTPLTSLVCIVLP